MTVNWGIQILFFNLRLSNNFQMSPFLTNFAAINKYKAGGNDNGK
jgi:hypothetical protein